jgi:hypothetical protein
MIAGRRSERRIEMMHPLDFLRVDSLQAATKHWKSSSRICGRRILMRFI